MLEYGGEKVPCAIVSARPPPSRIDFFVKYYQWVIVLYCLSWYRTFRVVLGDEMGDGKVRLPTMANTLNRRPTKALTAQFVKNTKTPGKYFDGYGLYMRVYKNGTKFWVQRIVIKGKRTELGYGPVELKSLADVRVIALENYNLAHSGGDPLNKRAEEMAILSFAEATKKVYALYRPTWKNKKHAQQFLSTLETYAWPKIGKIKIDAITPSDVLRVLTPIWTTKHETARRVLQRISTVIKWTIAQGWRQDNPADNVALALPKMAKVKEHRKALPYERVAECIERVKNSKAGVTTKLAFEFLVLSASRSGETRGALWSEIDTENAVWEIPAERMKMKRPHRVPLTKRMLDLLQEAKKYDNGSGLVFPSVGKRKSLSDATLSKLIKELGFEADVHGFRTSFRTWAQEKTNFPREVAEMALAHNVGNAVEQAYARSDLFDKRRKLMETWAAFLSDKVGNVIELRA